MRCPTLSELPPPPPGKIGWPWTEESPCLPATLADGRPWPRVSVVTPSYNQAQFIEETIRSVLLQGYPNLEYVVIDGGSSDGSQDIIRKYEPWLVYWVSESDRGQAHAINKGWARATGDLFAYINSDDYYLKQGIAAAAREFLARPDVGMLYGTAMIVDERGKEVRAWKARPFDMKIMLTEDNIVPQPAAFFSAQALQRLGHLDERMHMILDYELVIRIGMHFPAVCLPGTLARFRDHSRSKTRSQFEKTARELIQFGSTFFAQEVARLDLQAVKAATLGRYHYMLALGYLAQGRQQAAQALGPLLYSLRLYPPYALRRPIQTAYVVKEILLGYLARARGRVTAEFG